MKNHSELVFDENALEIINTIEKKNWDIEIFHNKDNEQVRFEFTYNDPELFTEFNYKFVLFFDDWHINEGFYKLLGRDLNHFLKDFDDKELADDWLIKYHSKIENSNKIYLLASYIQESLQSVSIAVRNKISEITKDPLFEF